MAKDVYVAAVGLTKVDLTGRIFTSIFDLFGEAYRKALQDSSVRSFDALQVGIMDSEEFENRANIATKIADRLGLTGVPAVRSETASSTGAAAFHEAYYKIASGEFDNILVLAGERMKMVTTEVATAIMSKTVDPEERRFGFTMPALIALITQATCWRGSWCARTPWVRSTRWRRSSAGPSRWTPTSTPSAISRWPHRSCARTAHPSATAPRR
jgi:acetyl-CoA acetyltransferase